MALLLAGKRCASAAVLANSEACTLVALGCNIDMVALVTASDRCSMATFEPSESAVVTSESVEAGRTDWDQVGKLPVRRDLAAEATPAVHIEVDITSFDLEDLNFPCLKL